MARALTLALAAAALVGATVRGSGLVDDPVAASATQYLDGEGWTATSADGSIVINSIVPGDLVTDLQRAVSAKRARSRRAVTRGPVS